MPVAKVRITRAAETRGKVPKQPQRKLERKIANGSAAGFRVRDSKAACPTSRSALRWRADRPGRSEFQGKWP